MARREDGTPINSIKLCLYRLSMLRLDTVLDTGLVSFNLFMLPDYRISIIYFLLCCYRTPKRSTLKGGRCILALSVRDFSLLGRKGMLEQPHRDKQTEAESLGEAGRKGGEGTGGRGREEEGRRHRRRERKVSRGKR